MQIPTKMDPSILFFERLSSQDQPYVEILMVNGKRISGCLIGFYRGDPDLQEPFVRMWHVVDEVDRWALGVNRFGILMGELIRTEDIKGIKLIPNSEWFPFHE